MDFEKLKNEPYWALLYSGRAPGKQHILAYGLDKLYSNLNKIEGRLYGYVGYNYRHELEDYLADKNAYIATLPIALMSLKNQQITNKLDLPQATPIPLLKNFRSNFTDAEYLAKVAAIIEKIKAGDLYQANLTRKFFAEFEEEPDAFNIFCALAALSPAPYSAYMRMSDLHIISASPEKFISMENGKVTTTPIKGTLTSAKPANELANSTKDKAENLMIVDLMRNDLARVCKNVQVEKLYEITSYPQYHHMSSTITGQTDANAAQVLQACFPPGSMTGAPKIAAVNLCSQLENWERGIYSGALGWMEPYACDLSVVIRTIIIKGNKLEFQVGGGIVADSVPEKELAEIYVKASGIMKILGLKI